ncbi:mycothione reductase [Marmoricola endophyticus]|uniref:Mycothione reductase n=1 Tax=Marmoricola endophyticus TaxID=2040280 RepID=A0A917BG68_9ACTN|nr:mycothione reductase [Marmoricola endophyticus]GGF41426.1 mycothione reductase [Marmoricola endophyticus]
MTHYDLVVLGTGSGNTIVNRTFADWSCAIIERRTFGGTCINRGCIPSKMFAHPATVLDEAAEGGRLGVRTTANGADWPAVRDRVFGRIDPDVEDAAAFREGQDHVTVYAGEARFTAPRTLSVQLESGETVEVSGDQVVIAAGSRPVVPPIEGLDTLRAPATAPPMRPDDPGAADWYTSDEVMRIPELPRRLAVLGGGYVGVELAHVFAAYGSQVTQVDVADTLISNQDAEVATMFTRFAREQWDVRTGTSLERVEKTDSGVVLHLSGDQAGSGTVEVDALLLAVGRKPNGDRLDVEKAGVEVDDDGIVVVDELQRTSAEGVWALGDVSSHTPLKHSANHDARVVKHNLHHVDDPAQMVAADHEHVPSAVFSHPQVASVGLTEEQAREQGIDLAVGRHTYAEIAYGWAMEDDHLGPNGDNTDAQGADLEHFVKLLGDRATGRLVGAHLIGPQASVLIQPLIMAISQGVEIGGLARSMYWIHPALTEVVENALLKLEADLDR